MKTQIETIREPADQAKALNFVFLADGFRESEMKLFRTTAHKLADHVRSQQPFSAFVHKLNFYALPTPSIDSGISDGISAVVRKTAFFTQQNYGGVQRVIGGMADRLVIEAIDPFFEDGEEVQPIVIANTSASGGSGGAVVYVSRHADAGKILVHELGHAVGELGDEYTNEIPYWPRFARRNLSLTPDPKLVPWSDMVGQPDGLGGVIGVYEGGGYHKKGIWRPTKSGCGMAALGKPFCAVCSRAIAARLSAL